MRTEGTFRNPNYFGVNKSVFQKPLNAKDRP